jgi:hypothetical protein
MKALVQVVHGLERAMGKKDLFAGFTRERALA